MLATKVKMLMTALLPVAVLGFSLGMHSLLTALHGTGARGAEPEGPKPVAVQTIPGQAAKPGAKAPALDHYGDPLPPGAIARLGTIRFRSDGETWALTFSRDGKMLVSRSGSRFIVWDAATGKERYRLPVQVGFGHPGQGPFAVSPDGTILAIIELSDSGPKSKISLWELRTGKPIRSLALPEPKNAGFDRELGLVLCFTPDGKSLAMARGKTLCS